ncbi:MAG: acyl-CoA thioester hydrolase/BAAT C-terminal domain-containing protein [Janthinobacterium lividum]
MGHSTGDFSTATSADFADDAEAAVNYIKSRADLKSLSVGLMGHSKGGMIAPMVASRNKNVDFIVLLAGPGTPIKELMLQQTADQARLGGATPDEIKQASVMNEQVFALVNQHQKLSTAQLKPVLDTMLYQSLRKQPAASFKGKKVEDIVEQSHSVLSPWFRYFLAFNSADYLTKIKCPALNGTLDMQVNSTANLAAIGSALRKAGNKNFKVMPMTGLNHLFQQAKTGSVAEYAANTETVNLLALQTVSGWISRL